MLVTQGAMGATITLCRVFARLFSFKNVEGSGPEKWNPTTPINLMQHKVLPCINAMKIVARFTDKTHNQVNTGSPWPQAHDTTRTKNSKTKTRLKPGREGGIKRMGRCEMLELTSKGNRHLGERHQGPTDHGTIFTLR